MASANRPGVPEALPVDGHSRTVGLVLHFRDAAMTIACLESLFDDGVTAAVIVDNSADNGQSLSAVDFSLEAHRQVGRKILVETPRRNLGFAAGINRGLDVLVRAFGARYVLIINNDACIRSGSIENLMAALLAINHTAVAGAQISKRDHVGGVAFYQKTFGFITRRPLPFSVRHLSGCCLLVPPSLARAPLFDERFFFYGDDVELGWRMQQRQVQLVLVDSARVEHPGSASSRKGSFFYEYHMVRAHWLLSGRLSTGPLDRLLMLTGRLAWLPVRAGIRAFRQGSGAPLIALLLGSWDVAFDRSRNVQPRPGPGSTDT